MNYHNDDGECGSCTRCAKIHELSSILELNQELRKQHWIEIPQKISEPLPFKRIGGCRIIESLYPDREK